VIDFDEPFSGRAALAAGVVTRHRLARDFVHLHRDVYIRRGIPATPLLRAKAAWLWSQGRGVLVGVSAAAVHGTRWLDPDAAAELVRSDHVRSVPGISVRRAPKLETCVVDGMVATTPAQTAFDLARRMPFDRAIETVDALCNATGLKVREIEDSRRGARARTVSVPCRGCSPSSTAERRHRPRPTRVCSSSVPVSHRR